jgi:hypothetical protein
VTSPFVEQPHESIQGVLQRFVVVLHENARLVKMEPAPVWHCHHVYFEPTGRSFDLRLLKNDEALEDTLNGFMWLLDEGNTHGDNARPVLVPS